MVINAMKKNETGGGRGRVTNISFPVVMEGLRYSGSFIREIIRLNADGKG